MNQNFMAILISEEVALFVVFWPVSYFLTLSIDIMLLCSIMLQFLFWGVIKLYDSASLTYTNR